VQLKFTERVYPHLAAREQHLKEPPFPKIKKNDSKENVDFLGLISIKEVIFFRRKKITPVG